MVSTLKIQDTPMSYEYCGYLKTILDAPDEAARAALDAVVFGAPELRQWSLSDHPGDLEWQRIPVSCKAIDGGVRLEGRFNDIRQIDNLSPDDPSFWVSISTLCRRGSGFPIDTARYPIAEITYRCETPNARPAWMWTYPGGNHLDGLPPSQDWRTMARRISHRGFPAQLDAIIVRLYSTSRSFEALDIAEIRFRAMTEAEASACREDEARLEPMRGHGPNDLAGVKHYPLLDDFYPFGTYMDAGTSKRMAAMLGVSLMEYWGLIFEDLARHHHNCVALEKVDRLTAPEWRDLLVLAEQFGLRFYVIHEAPPGAPKGYYEDFVDSHVRPYANSNAILAWSLHDEPGEEAFAEVLLARSLIEEADPNHPHVVMERSTKTLPLMAPYASVAGMGFFATHSPWEVGSLVRTHLPLCGGQQMWFVAPAFVFATDTPEWYTCPEMRLMLNLALVQGARGWFTFAMHNDPIWIRGSCQRTLTGPFLAFSDLWSELGQRVESVAPLVPLFMHATPQDTVEEWFRAQSVARANAQLPEGVAPVTLTRFVGSDYELFCVVSNDIREMTTVFIDIGREMGDDMALFDVTDYVRTREWAPAENRRHLEMFPGQLRVMLLARHEVCEHWRRVITARMIDIDRRTMAVDLALAHAYGLNAAPIERMLEAVGTDATPSDIAVTKQARAALLNLIYGSRAICESRSAIIEATAAVCACDGSLCRLLARGKADLARQLGFKVIPLAREFTTLRIELRRGQGAAILELCRDLAKRAIELLAEIRAAT